MFATFELASRLDWGQDTWIVLPAPNAAADQRLCLIKV